MGLFWQQLAGVGHDLGHTGVTHIFHRDHLIGSGLGALMGLSTCWWKSDHNTHHVACNAVEHDPNIQHMPMLAITEKIFRQPFYDTYHGKWVAMDALARALVSRQHFFFYPLMAVARFNLYAQGARARGPTRPCLPPQCPQSPSPRAVPYCPRSPSRRSVSTGLIHLLVAKRDTMHHRAVELASLAVFAAWFGTLLYAQPSRGDAWAWLLLSHAVAGVLHVQICLSHWSLESYLGSAYNSDEDEWHVGGLSS
jgi:delta8-fatty-acid desaturase